MNNIRENIQNIREKMAAAARAAGRDPSEILLCAASKMNDAERVQEAVRGGVDCCGENRVQELQDKLPKGAYTGKPVHFIGHLQLNKVNKVVGFVDLIQSVDRPELLAAIDKEARKKGLRPGHPPRGQHRGRGVQIGLHPRGSHGNRRPYGGFSRVRLRGLMAIPPISQNPGDNRKYFAEMENLFVDIARKKYDNVTMVCLSMGMSDDFEDAIAEGSTMVRVGTAIFGPRNYNK